MKHLIDEREPITMTDIDQAIADATYQLSLEGHAAHAPAAVDVIARLLAIVENTYGQAHGPKFRTED